MVIVSPFFVPVWYLVQLLFLKRCDNLDILLGLAFSVDERLHCEDTKMKKILDFYYKTFNSFWTTHTFKERKYIQLWEKHTMLLTIIYISLVFNTWCASSCATTMATICLSAALDVLGLFNRYVSRNVTSPQFSIAPAAKSGTATRSAKNIH